MTLVSSIELEAPPGERAALGDELGADLRLRDPIGEVLPRIVSAK